MKNNKTTEAYWLAHYTEETNVKFQNIECIYEYFKNLEVINKTSDVSLVLNKKSLAPTDTLSSIRYESSDFIVGEIVDNRKYNQSPRLEKSHDEVVFKITQNNHRSFLMGFPKKRKNDGFICQII